MKINDFTTLNLEEVRAIVVNTSRKMNISEAIIEKDFWVCWILKYLFELFEYKNHIAFKGGTSLSKVYQCIERFSEDIDIALDWDALEISKEELFKTRSNRQQEKFKEIVNEKTTIYLKQEWLPIIQNYLNDNLKNSKLYIDDKDSQTICFQYPKLFDDTSILKIIRLEIGVLADPSPASWEVLQPYIIQAYPGIIEDDDIRVYTVDVNRTFFEKVTILHRESYRINKNYPSRYSRHFYDVYQLIRLGYATKSIEHLDLLEQVISFKKQFYSCNWAN